MNMIEELLAQSGDSKESYRAKLRVHVAEILLLLMEDKGITKSDLASALQVTRSAVTQALSGDRNMSLNFIADVAAAIGANVRFELVAEAKVPTSDLIAQPAAAAPMPVTVDLPLGGADTGAPRQVATAATGDASTITYLH